LAYLREGAGGDVLICNKNVYVLSRQESRKLCLRERKQDGNHRKGRQAIVEPITGLVEATERPADGPESRARWCCEQLEEGNILFFSASPIDLPEGDREFLLSQRQSGAAYHKNIAYRPKQDRLTGFASRTHGEPERLRAIMRAYSERVTRFLSELLPQYAGTWRLDLASFRPQEEQGRQLRLRARNDLLHVDSFPTRPTNGDRILRVFTNINPTQPRIWLTTETFEGLAQRFWRLDGAAGRLPRRASWFQRVAGAGAGRALLRLLGLPVAKPSPYAELMIAFHHYLKEHRDFQETCPKMRWEFPPNSTWIVFTDMVAHAVLAGQFALEQTYIVSRSSLVLPHKAPVSILESLLGRELTQKGG